MILFPVPAHAAESMDPSRDCTLTVSYQDDGDPLTGVNFSLYPIAVADESGTFTVTEDFARYPVTIQAAEDTAWRVLASTLEGYVLRDGLVPADSGVTDLYGRLTFPTGNTKPVPGLYLVIGSRHWQYGMIYDAQPSIVLLPTPGSESGNWNYDVVVTPKHASYPEMSAGNPMVQKVLKIWEDDGYEADRPAQITVDLLRDGTVYDTVTLNAANNWRYVWSDLDNSYRWLVVEKELENYTVELTQEGTTFVLKNIRSAPDTPPTDPTVPSSPSDPKLPQTGQLWWPVPLLVSMGLLLIVAGLIRRRRISDEEQ